MKIFILLDADRKPLYAVRSEALAERRVEEGRFQLNDWCNDVAAYKRELDAEKTRLIEASQGLCGPTQSVWDVHAEAMARLASRHRRKPELGRVPLSYIPLGLEALHPSVGEEG